MHADQESIPRKVKTILHAGIPSGKYCDGMALEKEKQEINNVKYIMGNQDVAEIFSYNIL